MSDREPSSGDRPLHPDPIHRGEARTSPYPVSRLAPAFGLVDLAAEVERAHLAVSGQANAQLELIAKQIRQLQAEARAVLEKAQQDVALHQARCSFRKIPGQVYHLYRLADGTLQFSRLSPADWNGRPPHEHVGSWRLEADQRWTPVDDAEAS